MGLFWSMQNINVLFLVQITLHIRNRRNVKLQVRILQLHIVICHVILPFEELFPNLLEKNWKFSFVKLKHECANVGGSEF